MNQLSVQLRAASAYLYGSAAAHMLRHVNPFMIKSYMHIHAASTSNGDRQLKLQARTREVGSTNTL